MIKSSLGLSAYDHFGLISALLELVNVYARSVPTLPFGIVFVLFGLIYALREFVNVHSPCSSVESNILFWDF